MTAAMADMEWCAVWMLRDTMLVCATLPCWLNESVTRIQPDGVSLTEALAWELTEEGRKLLISFELFARNANSEYQALLRNVDSDDSVRALLRHLRTHKNFHPEKEARMSKV